ncbi:14 kDa fatty acid-binding protein-like, partial [Argonauta hians]
GVPEEHQVPFMNSRITLEYGGEPENLFLKMTQDGVPGTKQYDFKLGEEFSSTDMFGKPFTGLVTKLADNKVKEIIKRQNGIEMVSIRTIENGEMIAESSVKGVSMVLKFKKL